MLKLDNFSIQNFIMKKFFLLFFVLPYTVSSQDTELTRADQLYKKAEMNIELLLFNTAYQDALGAYEIRKAYAIDTLIAKSALQLNTICLVIKKTEAEKYLVEAEQIGLQLNNYKILSEVYLKKGNYYRTKFEKEKALNFFIKVDSIQSQHKFKDKNLVKAYRAIALLLLPASEQDTTRFSKTESYIEKIFNISKEINYKNGEIYALELMGIIEVRRKNIPKGISLYKAALKKATELNDIYRMSTAYWTLGTTYLGMKQFDSAEFYYKKKINILTDRQDPEELALAYSGLGDVYDKVHKYRLGVDYHLKAINLFYQSKTDKISQVLGTLDGLRYSYAGVKDYENAYIVLDKTYRLRDSLVRTQNMEASIRIEARYLNDKKEKEIKLLTVENKLVAANQAKQRNLFIGLFFIILSGGGAVFYAYKNKIKTANKLKEIDQLKSRFFANISHEFRTPLTLIKSPLQSLQSSSIDEEQKRQLHLIDVNSNRMLELVNQLLALSKIDSGSLKLILKEGDLSSFLHSIIEPFTFHAQENKIEFKSVIEKSTQPHHFDKDIIEKIVTNLLANAFKYTLKNEAINFSSSINENQLHLIVSNTGSDLRKEEMAKLFERFYQKNETRQGIGIGLALVKELVELYHGKIDVTIVEGVLSFSVALPLQIDAINAVVVMKEMEDRSITEINENKEDLPILLVVDDNQEIRRILVSIFKNTFCVIEAEDGEKGLRVAQKEIPDCIVSDVMMPKMDGFAFTKAIKENEITSFIPVVLLTAKTSDEAHLDGLKSTADAFLTKPFNHSILQETVNQLLQERKKLRQRYSKELILKPLDVVINSTDEKFLDKLQHLINEQLSNPDFSADDFANKMGMGKMQLYRKLKSLIGLSSTEYLRSERLKTSAKLLKKGNGNVSEIAYSVGFNDLSYFSKCFKEMYHCSPSEFSKK